MKNVALALLVAIGCGMCFRGAVAEESNPLSKVIDLLGKLQQNVIKEGSVAQKIYGEVAEGCEDRSRQLHFEIKTAKARVQDQKATLEEESARILALQSKIESLAASQSQDDAMLKDATELRKKEALTFAELEKELVQQLDAIRRATSIVTKQASSGAAFAQLSGSEGLLQVFQAMVDANEVSNMDAERLSALVQTGAGESEGASEDSDENMEMLGAPAAEVYSRKSGAVVEALEGLQEKAEDQLDKSRQAESNAAANFDLKKQALGDQIKLAISDLATAKQDLASSSETKATAEGELSSTMKDLKEDMKVLGELHHDCMEKATSFQEQVKSRDQEVAALAKAKQIIKETTGAAETKTYSMAQSGEDQAPALVQMKMKMKTKAMVAGESALRAVHLVRHLAASLNSDSLAQLASRIGTALRTGTTNTQEGAADPFAKVKTMIQDMLAKLDSEASEAARHKAYCDKELADTMANEDDKHDDVESLGTKIEQLASQILRLKGDVAELNKELGHILKSQAQMDRLRLEEKTVYEREKPELESGIDGVKMALRVLKEYYAQADDASHGAETSAAGTIIGALEVVESDFSKQLAEVIAEEERAAREYAERSQENKVAVGIKETDIKYKTKQIASLEKTSADIQGDLSTTDAEWHAVEDYYTNLKKSCGTRAEPYEERMAAREKEIKGLQEALDILTSEAAASFVQTGAKHRTLRGLGTRQAHLKA